MIKVLVVGQTPPPFGGQAVMIERLVTAHIPDVQIIHVRMGFSSHMNEVGHVRLSKILHLVGVVVKIVYRRLVDRPQILYYPPAGPDRVPVIRDILILLCTRWLFAKTVFHFHAGGVSELYERLPGWQRWLFRRAYWGADAAVRLSELNPEDGRRLAAKREYVTPYGIDDPCPELQQPNKEKSPSQHGPLRILFVGVLRESKGVQVLLEACGQLRERGVAFQADLLGQWQSEEFAQAFRRRAEELNVADRMTCHGAVTGNKKFDYFRQADVFCFPSFFESEALPVVLLEATACGLPIVSTRWRGIPSIVDDGQTGFLVEPRDATAVADRLTCLAEDAELRQRFGAAARRKYEQEFTVARHLERMRRTFLEVGGAVPEATREVSEALAAI